MDKRIGQTVGMARKAIRAYRNAGITEFQPKRITREQCMLLFLISNTDMTQKEISDELDISEATLSVRIKRLEKAGLIKRTQHAVDKRKYVLEVTREGKKELDDAQEFVDKLSVQAFTSFTDEEFEQLNHLFEKIYNNLKGE